MKDITTEKAINRIHDLIHTCDVGIEKQGAYDDLFALDKQALEKVLDELEKKDKIIDAMAKFIDTELSSEHLTRVLEKEVLPLKTYRNDIKQYFEKEVKDE